MEIDPALPEEGFSAEEMEAKSFEVRESRAGKASLQLAFYAVRAGMAGNSSKDIAQHFLMNLFHLADLTGFNLESVIDQARWEFQGQKKIDEIEEEHLQGAILEDRKLAQVLKAGGAEIHAEFSDVVAWSIPEGKSPRKKG